MSFRSLLSRINFRLHRNPVIDRTRSGCPWIPEKYKTVLLISADFELAWAWRYAKCFSNPLGHALGTAKRERQNIPAIIALCEKYNIPITWATVGHLFLENCEKRDGLAHSNLPRLSHFENDFWKFTGRDWFEHDPCTDVTSDPEWYCPDLIKMIMASPVEHEIGCHTFSHIDCREEICPPALLQSELNECRHLAARFGLELKSFVHPGHTIGNLDVLAAEGFTNFRTDYRNVLGYPKKHANGLWEFEQTAELVFRRDWPVAYHIHRYKEIINRAVQSGTVCVFWFHPSFDGIIVDEILPEIFAYAKANNNQILVTTHGKYVDWLNRQALLYE